MSAFHFTTTPPLPLPAPFPFTSPPSSHLPLPSSLMDLVQGDTLESVAKELESISKTGIYTFHLAAVDNMGVNGDHMLLEYHPASIQPVTPHLEMKNPLDKGAESPVISAEPTEVLLQKHSRKEKWNLEQIGDFVRKLGFLDENKEEEGGVRIKHFLLLNQVCSVFQDFQLITFVHY